MVNGLLESHERCLEFISFSIIDEDDQVIKTEDHETIYDLLTEKFFDALLIMVLVGALLSFVYHVLGRAIKDNDFLSRRVD